MTNKPLDYQQAVDRIDEIMEAIEQGGTDIDTLISLVKEAAELITSCKAKLHHAEEDLQSALDKLH